MFLLIVPGVWAFFCFKKNNYLCLSQHIYMHKIIVWKRKHPSLFSTAFSTQNFKDAIFFPKFILIFTVWRNNAIYINQAMFKNIKVVKSTYPGKMIRTEDLKKLCHTTLSHTTLSHTTWSHTTLTHITFSHNIVTHTQLLHT